MSTNVHKTRIWLAVTAIARDILPFLVSAVHAQPAGRTCNAECVRGPDNLYHNAATPTTQSVWSGSTLMAPFHAVATCFAQNILAHFHELLRRGLSTDLYEIY